MEVTFFKVLKADPNASTITTQKGEQIQKRSLVLQECGGPYENSYVVTTLGEDAGIAVNPGDIVMARLRFTAHEYQGKSYMDCTATSFLRVAQKSNRTNNQNN